MLARLAIRTRHSGRPPLSERRSGPGRARGTGRSAGPAAQEPGGALDAGAVEAGLVADLAVVADDEQAIHGDRAELRCRGFDEIRDALVCAAALRELDPE